MRFTTVDPNLVKVDVEALEISHLVFLSSWFGAAMKYYSFLCPPIVAVQDGGYKLIGRSYSFLVLATNDTMHEEFGVPVILVEEDEVSVIDSVLESEYIVFSRLYDEFWANI